MNKQIVKLEESIADKIKNYQRHLNGWVFDDRHVDTWIKQFPEEERVIVLTETDSLLAHNYIKKRKIKEFFDVLWNTEKILGTNPRSEIDKIQFLNIQGKGNSQNRLIDLLGKHYYETKDININKRNRPKVNKYIYLDDCMFTGFTLIKDISGWIEDGNPNYNSHLFIVLIGAYTGNWDYVLNQLREKCLERSISVDIFCAMEYNNDFKTNPPYDVLWPQFIDDDEYVNAFVREMKEQKEVTGKGGLGFRIAFDTEEESVLFTSSIAYSKFMWKIISQAHPFCMSNDILPDVR